MIIKRIFALITLILVVVAVILVRNKSFAQQELSTLKDGDLIFQTSLSAQSMAIQKATGSPYSHCGIIYKQGTELYVFEAVEPVKLTPINQWIAHGKNGKFVVKRLKNAAQVINKSVLTQMKIVGENLMGKHYDLTFEWSDDKIYCSELIWKIYQRTTGIELGKLQKLKDFNLSNQTVMTKLKQRYGNNIPLDEKVISPKDIFDSDKLITVLSN